ncbi:MAG: hypothetical protein FWG99_10640, partial [Treponema sp.]|nr:hypothetical protein [Treponema sp.]
AYAVLTLLQQPAHRFAGFYLAGLRPLLKSYDLYLAYAVLTLLQQPAHRFAGFYLAGLRPLLKSYDLYLAYAALTILQQPAHRFAGFFLAGGIRITHQVEAWSFAMQNSKVKIQRILTTFPEQGGFGVPVVNVLFTPSTPACALPVRPCTALSTARLTPWCLTGALRFESPFAKI